MVPVHARSVHRVFVPSCLSFDLLILTCHCSTQDPRYKSKDSCSRACFVTKWAGDGNCDDQNNVCGCDWDGGDCCGTKKNVQYCTHCGCRDPKHNSKRI